ncbi:hypothetical protein GCM10028827_38940 [Mucilaginibacter myungsuensis]
MMIKYLTFFALMGWGLTSLAQIKMNNFRIVDAETKLPIPYVSISLSRANVAMNTEQDGLLSIPGDLATFRDTVFIAAQNYLIIKAPIRSLNGLDTIRLRKSAYRPPLITPSNTGTDTVLNKFNWRDVCFFAGVHTENARFSYLQMAQEFDVPVQGATLKQISICRLAHMGLVRMSADGDVIIMNQEKYVQLELTKFRLRFYDVDPRTGGPGRDIYTKVVEVSNKDDRNLKINLKEYSIIIPGKKFFVAVEWLRTFDNAGYAEYRSEQNLIYKPTLGMLPYATGKLKIWGLTYGHKWQPYTYYSPDWTDLAISATVKW